MALYNIRYSFAIADGNDGGNFAIDSSGRITLNDDLNAMVQDAYTLTITASSVNYGCQCDRTTVEVSVLASNDNPPIFNNVPTVDILETTPVGTIVANVTATDADFGINGEIRYSILSVDPESVFEIDTISGSITLTETLNHTLTPTYTLMLQATDQAVSNQMSGDATQVINVLDVNQQPFFLTPCTATDMCRFLVSEGESINTTIAMLMAGDPDSSSIQNGQIGFTIDPGNTAITINEVGNFVLSSTLDRETQDSYSFTVTVSDTGSPPLDASTTVLFIVTDVNDNAPMLIAPSEVSISESTSSNTVVATATAFDPDLGSYGQVSFQLSGPNIFTIDEDSGQISLVGTLDYETATQHTVVLTATDFGNVSSSEHTLTINVINENDNAPIFTMDPYRASVAENSDDGTSVEVVEANDRDSGVLGDVTYSITSGNSNNNFAINSTSGMITVSGDIDREVVGEYRLTVRAQDGGNPARSDVSTVIITVLDVNDNSPVFQRSSYSISVREDASVPLELLTLLATDADEAGTNYSAITYSIESGNVESVFDLSANTGVFRLVGELDFETLESYSLTVIATDGGSRTGNAVVMVTVIDVNDEAPEISGDQTIPLSEFTPIGDNVTQFTATGEEGEILTFSIMPDNCFDIDPTTGVVTLAASLDYETQQIFTAEVSVTDGLFSASATLTVNVVDENDNAPQITSIGPFTVEEETPEGTLVGTIIANDLDTVGDPLSFSFVGTKVLSYFTINSSTGEIFTADILDREALESVFPPPGSSQTYRVNVSDGVLSSFADVTITLLDINDNSPIFNGLLTEYDVLENSAMGVEVFVVTATDDDLGSNAIVSYSISTSPFAIDTSTGSVTVAGVLDYEMATEHSVTITASDGTLSSNQNVTIRVVDVNDNAPVFSQDTYTAMVVEHSSVNTVVSNATAIDDDSGVNGRVSYSLANTNTFFSINPSSGEIVVIGDIDRETITQFTFTVVATDGGNPAQRDTASVIVSVTDINDNAPTFQQSSYTVRVREDAATSSEILTVLATDNDEPGNPNSQIVYSFQPDNAVFSISGSGVISLQATLDFENASSYSLVAVATDRGDPMMNGTTNVNIIVINVNDQPPEFSGDQSINLSELTPVLDQIVRFNATGEMGETLTYTLSGTQNGEFEINATTGIVTLVSSLDYETTQFYALNVTASDNLFTTSSTLNITVLDENDNTPQFDPVSTLQIDEEQPVATSVGQVTASDADSGVNAELTYSFVQSSTQTYFTIDTSSGEITTASSLDRELLVQENLFLPPASQITFQVQVTDGGSPPLFSQVDVTVQLNDTNDNPPQFINPPANVCVSESEVSGFVVTTLSADDADIGQNAIISFSLTGSSLFSINSTSGVVTLVGSLDYETTTEYTVEVTASNPDGLSTQHTLTLHVLNENDNSPIFTMDPYTASVAEHSNTSTSVVTIEANDADSGVLGEVTYSITNGNTGDVFTIDSMTGLVSVNNDIDREATDSYTLVVSAIDGGGRSTDANVTVTITDINDNVPVFDPSSYSINVHENTSVNSILVTVTATDDDIGVNGEIIYSIESGNDNNLFSISEAGDISLTSSLDFETNPSHTLFVQAADNGEPSLTAVAVVFIEVTDINDEVPDLGGDQAVAISEYTTVNSRIAEFSVSNIEQGDNITFELSGTQAEDFEINPSNGVITLAQSLDHEVRPSYDLTVSVSDGVFPSSAQLTVTVLDENDNTPQFQGTGPFNINEEMPANTSVGQVMATDGDSGLNGEIVFSIIRNVGDLFAIDTSSGVITTTVVLDREALADMNLFVPPGSLQLLTIQAEDSGSPSLFTQVDVTVMLADINDNAPQFGDVPSTISFPENIPVNTFILDASATDADIGPNGEITYSISSSMSPLPFTIDPSTGAVSTNATLDREQVDNYIFSIVATDNGALVQMSSSVTVNLTVTDINDNAPVFRGEPYEESIPEDASTDGGGSIPLVTVFATDSDIGNNSIITYSLAPGTNSRFRIRSNTGDLSVSGGINFEEETEFNVTVIARDMGLPSLSSSTIVRIRIINVDEFAPDFIGSCDVTIPEDRNVSRDSNPVTQCIAVDQDSGDVFYDILIEDNPALNTFSLDPDSGEVFLVQPLDREMYDQYQFTLQARSAGGPQVSPLLVTIKIGDVNDNAPVFNPNHHTITYDNLQSHNIVTLTVSDADINENGEFTVEVTSITRTSESHAIVITAVDMGTPSMSGSATVTVNNAFPCQIMEFSLDPDTLQLSAATLCSLSNPPVSQDYILGTPVSLDCSAVSNLPVTYQWQRDGSFITDLSNVPVLNIGEIGFDDVGSYSCIARSSVGSIQSISAFIGVHGKWSYCCSITAVLICVCCYYTVVPVIIRPPEAIEVEVNSSIMIPCVSEGVPQPNVTFYFNGEEMKNDDERITIDKQIVTIDQVDKSDDGIYHCSASNIADSIESSPVRVIIYGQYVYTSYSQYCVSSCENCMWMFKFFTYNFSAFWHNHTSDLSPQTSSVTATVLPHFLAAL